MDYPNVTRELIALEPGTRIRALGLKARMARLGHPIVIYVTWRSPHQQAIEHAQGQSRTKRGYHNLLNPVDGTMASRAIDTCFEPRFRGDDAFAPDHPWNLLRQEAELEGFWAEAWEPPLVDKGHYVNDPQGKEDHEKLGYNAHFQVLWGEQVQWQTLV